MMARNRRYGRNRRAAVAGIATADAAAAASDITSAASYLSGMQAQYGDIQKRVSNALTGQSTLNTSLQAQLSQLQDVDEAQAVTNQQTEATALNAAETAYASLPKKSLFDYLG
jgi:flagellin-like hook-associated protein FlgL